MHRLAEISAEIDLASFSRWLNTQQVEHRISEERDMQVLWVANEALGGRVQEALDAYLKDPDIHRQLDEVARSAIDVQPFNPWHRFRPNPISAPLTHIALLLMALIFLAALLGVGDAIYAALLIIDPSAMTAATLGSGSGRLSVLLSTLPEAPWRWLTPSFLHFSAAHLVFNGVMFWFLAGQLEAREGRGKWLVLFALTSLLGNVLQYFQSGPLFGGASGVVYGLLGYVWSVNRSKPIYLYPPMLFRIAVVWLLIGFTPLPDYLLGVNMANAAHLGGLLGGLILAQLPVRIRR